MTQPRKSLKNLVSSFNLLGSWKILVLGLAFFAGPALAQQTGALAGMVTDGNGAALAGVTVEASSNVLPKARTSTSAQNGHFRMPLLTPGEYDVRFIFADGSSLTRKTTVQLGQEAQVDIVFGATQAEVEEIVVTGTQMASDTGQGALKDSISAATIDGLPVGQEYRDLIKLIPGVQYSEDLVRGPSAGGNGQDNTYLFDGVDVSTPLFGTLAADPSSHDIAEVSIVRGGAKAIGFNRSGGLYMNTVSKSGTDEFHGEVSYQVQSASMTGDRDTGDNPVEFDEDKEWVTASLGGPIVPNHLFFYASYYSPTSTRDNAANAYGDVPDFDESRDEGFAKLTWAATDSLTFNGSYRSSETEINNRSVGTFGAASTSEGDLATLDIAILEGAWIINDVSSTNFKYTNFKNDTSSRPDTLFDFQIAAGQSLNIAALDTQGNYFVPTTIDGEDAYNAFIQPYIDTYGYSDNGVQTGGGNVGGARQLDDANFSRESFEISYDRLIYAGNTTHDLHFGYQFQNDEEELLRLSNGWGSISTPGGRVTSPNLGEDVFFEARFQQQSLQEGNGAAVPPIVSSIEMQSFEINDTIDVGAWVFNIGLLFSSDTLYGSGLAPDASNPVTGLTPSPGTKYEMYKVDWDEMIQPRIGATWNYSDTSSVYLNYAKYNPSASSLARAASWDRNLRRSIDAFFRADGTMIELDEVGSSSGKIFDDGLTPRSIDEILLGWTMDVSGDLLLRAHARYREGGHFWEDTSNTDRVNLDPPPGIPREPYIENLQEIRDEIGGSSFVIAELDTAYTKYYELSTELEWSRDNFFMNASYTWSHYYGNFDQDNTTTNNDQAIFIGSSNLADGAGRQLWNNKDGNLRGDRRHQFKTYGYYNFDWNGSAGAYLVYQSGQPWEAWDSNVYRQYTSSTSDTIRYAEPAGTNTTDAHWQLDLNYTQNFTIFKNQNLQLRADIFNVLDNQTGYGIQSKVNSAGFGDPTEFFNPRRIQVAFKYQF